jgi:hypothetical protein
MDAETFEKATTPIFTKARQGTGLRLDFLVENVTELLAQVPAEMA